MAVERTPTDALDDIVAMLQIVQPAWVGWYDPRSLKAHVREMLDEAIPVARETSVWASGCVRVEYDPEDGKIEVLVTACYSFDEPDLLLDAPSPSEGEK